MNALRLSLMAALVALVSSPALAAPAQEPSALMTFGPLVVLFVVFYFLLIRPQQKRQKEHKNMLEALNRGDEVVTQGGVAGKVTDLDDSFVSVEIAENTVVKVQRHAIGNVLPKGTLSAKPGK